jgi:tripartite-type tricarboxylate transporter receptor subunit TctC
MFALRYDLLADFEAVALVSSDPLLIVARKTMPANDLKEFVAWLKANPDQATQGTTGAGGISTVGGLFFRRATGTRFRFVPYRGGLGPAMQDLVAGQIDFMIDTAANSLPQVRAGRIKDLCADGEGASAGRGRHPDRRRGWTARALRPELASRVRAEGHAQSVTRLNFAIVAGLADPTVRRRLTDIGQEIFPKEQQTPQALAAYQKAEIEKWWPIVKEANIKTE